MKNKILEVRQAIVQIELENDYHNYQFDGYYVWGKIRNQIHYELISKDNNNRIEHTNNNKHLLKIFNHNLSQMKEKDTLVLYGHRKTKIDGKYEDLYTKELRDILDENVIDYNLFDEYSFNGNYYIDFKDNNYHNIELILLKKTMLDKIELSSKCIDKLHEITIKFEQLIHLDLEELITTVKTFIIESTYYSQIFKSKKVKNIFLPMYYTHLSIIDAAIKSNVNVSEIQYASLNANHFNYDFREFDKINYLPSDMILWSQYYKRDFLRYNNYFYVNKDISKVKQVDKKNKIVIISQDVYAEKLYELANNLTSNEELKDYEIVFKQHPWEQVKHLKNVKVITSDQDVAFIDVIKDAKYVISCFSTGIDEALQLGCNVMIYQKNHSSLLNDAELYTYVESSEDIVNAIKEDKFYHALPFDNKLTDLNPLINIYQKLQVDIKLNYTPLELEIKKQEKNKIALIFKYIFKYYIRRK